MSVSSRLTVLGIALIFLLDGAALVYVSAVQNKNCDLLYKYILNVLFGNTFTGKPNVIEKDNVFVPIGYDSISKIQLLGEHVITEAGMISAAFDEIIRKPPALQKVTVSIAGCRWSD